MYKGKKYFGDEKKTDYFGDGIRNLGDKRRAWAKRNRSRIMRARLSRAISKEEI